MVLPEHPNFKVDWSNPLEKLGIPGKAATYENFLGAKNIPAAAKVESGVNPPAIAAVIEATSFQSDSPPGLPRGTPTTN